MPSGMRQSIDLLHWCTASIYIFNPSFAADLFFELPFARLARVRSNRSTGSKQTLNGLFIFISPTPSTIFVRRPGLIYNFYPPSYRFSPVGPGQSSAISSRRDIITTEVYRWMEKSFFLTGPLTQPTGQQPANQ